VIQAVSRLQVLQKVRLSVAVELEDDTLCIDESTVIGELQSIHVEFRFSGESHAV
jgi:hypothetical protein